MHAGGLGKGYDWLYELCKKSSAGYLPLQAKTQNFPDETQDFMGYDKPSDGLASCVQC